MRSSRYCSASDDFSTDNIDQRDAIGRHIGAKYKQTKISCSHTTQTAKSVSIIMNFHLTYTVLFVAMLIRRSDPTTVHRQDIESVKWPPYTSLAVTIVMKHQSNIMTGRIHKTKAVLLYLCILLLAESYAPEPNPGPRAPKYPCGLCQKACKWTTPCVCCDSCDKWFHQECLHMPSAVFNALNDISWECCSCGMPNFSSGIFDTTFFDSSSNCSSLSSSSSNTSFGSPNATSSPTATANRNRTTEQNKRPDIPLRILIINCQSIKTPGKKGSLENMVTATNANIIIGNESWLDSTINSNEVFPNGFKVFRKDRNKQGGGVFILIADNLECDEVTTLTSTTAEMISMDKNQDHRSQGSLHRILLQATILN